MKRIIFDIGHPAQVHNFKHIYWELKKRGWEGYFVTKDKEICIYLLEKYNLPFYVLGKNQKGLFKKLLFLLKDIYTFNKIVKRFKPDIVVNRMSLHSTLVSKLRGINQISIADTEKSLNFSFLTQSIFTAYSFKKEFPNNHFRYKGNIELFYLHPNWYKPNESIYELLNIPKDQKYVIVRFVSWNAHHDVGQRGFSYEDKLSLIKELSKRAKVFISSEDKLPKELEEYQITIPPEKIHDALNFASLYIGEGATMASESAMLGTPAIYVNTLNSAGVFEDEERAGLLYRIVDGKEAIKRAVYILDNESKEIYKKRRDEYLKDQIDVTSYMVWVIENYPNSLKTIKEDSTFQERFK